MKRWTLRDESIEERIRLFEVIAAAWYRARIRGECGLTPLIEIAKDFELEWGHVKIARARMTRKFRYHKKMAESREMARFKIVPRAA